jgi:hypothetical protein
MAPRERFQYFPSPKGRVVTGGNLAAGGDYDVMGGKAYCADIVGQGDCAPLFIDHVSIDGGRVNVINDPNNYWENYRVDWLDFDNWSHLSPGLGQDRLNVDYATEAVARTNPSRPYVDIPVNVLELGDIARTIRRQGLDSIAALGRQNLRYNFGIAPLVGDLVRIAYFQDQVQRRIREMRRLEAPRGLRRTLSMGSWGQEASYDRVMQSNQYFWSDTVFQSTTQNIRAHVRWNVGSGYDALSMADRQRLAFRAVLGLTIDAKTLWEVIPWSWLIDWCSSAGNFFAATRNIIPALLSGVHIMRETHSEWRTNGGINSPIRVSRTTKTRDPSFVAPVAHFPFLTAGQMGILASLAVTRR